MQVCERGEMFLESDNDLVFDHMRLILKAENGEYFYATQKSRVPLSSSIDLNGLDMKKIPASHIWPPFSPSLTRAPEPPPANCFVKRPSLLDYTETNTHRIYDQILAEANICETLRHHPHPNIAEYIGCVEVDGSIHGLCFAKYSMTLSERVEKGTIADIDRFLGGIQSGVQHLHALGLIHNDINPRNIMMGENDRPIIINFDSCKREGEELVKMGTPGWMIDNTQYATPENDFFAISKLRELLHAIQAETV